MPPDLRSMLNDTEQALLREADDLERLDEDELAVLHDRIRRARNKYTKLYRRRASAQVSADAGRAQAHAANERAMVKAELFEDALARVSRRLAVEAKAAAAALKQERLSAARQNAAAAGPSTSRTPAAASGKGARSKPKPSTRTPASEKARASTKAAGQRKQAAKDKRPRG